MSEVLVRAGTAEDLPEVFKFVEELAEYERAADQVVTNAGVFATDFAAGWFELLIAEDVSGERLGIMLFHHAYSTWKGRMLYLEDFVVAENARRRGVGQKLWEALVEVAREKKCQLIKWQVLDWNEPAREFYKRQGAELEPGWENGKLFLQYP